MKGNTNINEKAVVQKELFGYIDVVSFIKK